MVDVRRPPEPGASEIGQRVRMIRKRRGLSLDAVAGLAGISKPYLSHLETGKRNFERRSLLENLAAALGCSVTDLTGQPYLPPDRGGAEALAAVRLALHDYGPDDIPDVTPRPLDQLTNLADRANAQCGQARYNLAGNDIGTVLTELQVHSRIANSAQHEQVTRALVTACFVAGVVASRLGNIDLAATAARRGYDLARRRDNPSMLGFARWYWAIELTTMAARTRAQAVLTRGIDELTPSVHLSTTDTLAAEMVGSMHLQHARASARQQRTEDAYAHLAHASDLARRVGERNGMGQHFGPTNVALWRLTVGIELSEGGRAYDTAMAAPLDASALGSHERSSSLQLDLARAATQHGGTHDAAAIRHLDAADRVAPQRIRTDPIARDLVVVLSRRARRQVWELDSLRNRFGVR